MFTNPMPRKVSEGTRGVNRNCLYSITLRLRSMRLKKLGIRSKGSSPMPSGPFLLTLSMERIGLGFSKLPPRTAIGLQFCLSLEEIS
ncbi:hypothetical protein NC651_036203 [Populus alba x Populus x berolinensis]|jgi:hypothetical protein|nr:hypothetical protein NC651_036203 [Populus alba x Populus x berolinensis]